MGLESCSKLFNVSETHTNLQLFWQFIAKQRHQTCGSGALVHLSHTQCSVLL